MQSDLMLINAKVIDSRGSPVAGRGANLFYLLVHLLDDGQELSI
jgi:hypothetical protein